MPSNIDPTKPVALVPTTQSVRDNFSAAKTEIEALQTGKANDTDLSAHLANVSNPHGVTAAQVALGNVDNTSNATERAAIATLENKRIKKRTSTEASAATPTINTDAVDFYSLTAQAVNVTSFSTNLTGTPTEGQTLWIAITGTASRAISWGAAFEPSTVPLPTTTINTARLDVGFIWNTATNKWRCIATA